MLCHSLQQDVLSASQKYFDSEYILGHEIGGGNFSVVRLGTHKQTGEKYAVKIVNRDKLPAEDEESLLMEVRLLLLQLCCTLLYLLNSH